jgi:hypothetical protein
MTDILQVECPKCGSRNGAHCVTMNGHRTSPHTQRLDELLAQRHAARVLTKALRQTEQEIGR